MVRSKDQLVTIVYRSTAIQGLGSVDLHEILSTSRVRNRTGGITGMLLLEGGRFLQALEGRPGDVDALMERIASDPRHRDVERLDREIIAERRFPDWAMANGHPGDLAARPLAQYFAALEGARHELPKPARRLNRFQEWLRG